MSIFNVNLATDGTYFEKYRDIGLWYSNDRVYFKVPRVWLFDLNGIAFLSYITETEYNAIVGEFGSDPNYALRQGPAYIDFFGPPIRISSSVPKGSVSECPYYFKNNNIDIHKLVYLTQRQIDFLKSQNIELANNSFFGPFRIPVYWSSGDPSGAGDSAAAQNSVVNAVTDSSGSPVRDGSRQIITSGGGGGSWDSGGYDSGTSYYPPPVPSADSGLYTGSLSAQGNMVAMQLNEGRLNVTEVAANNSWNVNPYHTGYFREYWRNPTTATFGSNTAMPALTGVMPDKYPGVPGNAVYYVDLQISRLSGSNQWDNNFFINSFNQALSYVLISNSYLAALKTAESTDLAYYGADSYQVLTTQGFNKYQVGNALTLAFRNIGKMAREITSGYFGTANAVAKVMIDLGLGYINNLAVNLYSAGVNFEDIGNEVYTPYITDQLRQITNTTDLQTIQEVLVSNIPNIANPLDFTRIDRSAGIPNDSEFADFVAVGVDFYNRAPNLILADGEGREIADLIDRIQSNVTANVEAVSNVTLINQDLIDNLRTKLPITDNNNPVSILNVVGMASGYLLEDIQKVNEGIAALYATDYGPRIRSTLTNISRYHAQVPLTSAELAESGTWWNARLEESKKEYYALIESIVADTTGNLPAIVDQINTNYDNFTSNIYYEYLNYTQANISTSNFGDTLSTLSFVQSLPGYAADPDNIGTDLLLYGITQNNAGGEIARTVLDQGKNDFFLSNAGVTITGII